MAFISCEECGGDVSDKAESCPKCGCPVRSETHSLDATKTSIATRTPIYGLFIGLALPFVIWPLFFIPIAGQILCLAALCLPFVLPFLMKKGDCPNCQKKNRFTKANKKCSRCKKTLYIDGTRIVVDR